MGEDHFPERIAAGYDAATAETFAPGVVDPIVDVLARLAGDGAALELGVGTGRIAIPLAARGVRVHGVDLSTAMVDRLRAKPGGETVDVTIGDMATVRVPATFRVAFVVFNTITNLLTQDEQVECFRTAAAHLEPGGCFVVETFVPGLRRLPPGESLVAYHVGTDRVDVDEYEVVDQRLTSHHWLTTGGGVEVVTTPHRYAWPAELDLMARIAGLRLRHRWADWHGAPFTSESTSHVSVWERAAA
ncbi:MAG: class I SAM-dependent methyltransferase [Ilumatobacteraceae bacterium]|jgi:SAM-dependent methyltransferase|nr:class I SAM-dependent methyltransferase [Ilumatobacteraceae bacterium]